LSCTRIAFPGSLSRAVLVAVLLSGCGDSSPAEPDGITIADLVGSWSASSVLFTNQANPSQQFDIIALGGELRVTVLQSGGARTWLDVGDVSDEWDAALTLSGTQLTSTPVESTRPTRHYAIELSGNVLTMTSTDASFDFTLSGATGTPATEVTVLVRQ
jgi:hypothetical protein